MVPVGLNVSIYVQYNHPRKPFACEKHGKSATGSTPITPIHPRLAFLLQGIPMEDVPAHGTSWNEMSFMVPSNPNLSVIP